MQQAVQYNDLIGVPFVNGGRDPAAGLDCWGLFMEVMQRFGTPVPDYKISCFDTTFIGRETRRELAKMWVATDKPSAGVAITLSIDGKHPGEIQHFGVCVNNRWFIHTLEKTNCILSKVNDPFWGRKIKGFYRCKK